MVKMSKSFDTVDENDEVKVDHKLPAALSVADPGYVSLFRNFNENGLHTVRGGTCRYREDI